MHDSRLSATDLWYRCMPGTMLLGMEQARLEKIFRNLLGDTLLQIGGPSDLSLVKSSTIPYRMYLSPDEILQRTGRAIQAKLMELPITPNTLDVVVLAHMLELVEQPKIVLSEIYQVLVDNGYLILLGFNPCSLWGIWRLIHRKQGFPWEGKFWSRNRVSYYLRSLGYQIVISNTLCFRPPLQSKQKSQELMFMEALGQTCVPACAAVYLLVAQKRVHGVTPLANKNWWEQEAAIENGFAKPTTRV